MAPVIIGLVAETVGLTWTLAGLFLLLLVVLLGAEASAVADQREVRPAA